MKGLAAVALIALAVSPALADPVRVERTDPDHRRALMQPPVVPKEFLAPRTRFIRSQAMYSLPKGFDGLAKFDPALSRLCQRGAFVQESDGFYWARTPDKRYGVAFSGGANLVDPQGKRQKGQVYFFDGQDSRCRVYVGEQARLMPNFIGPPSGQ